MSTKITNQVKNLLDNHNYYVSVAIKLAQNNTFSPELNQLILKIKPL